MTALVTGGSGFLGRALVARLRAERTAVRVLVRSERKAAPLREAGVDVVVGEINDPSAVERALAGVSVVYHLAGRLFIPGVAPSEYHATHVEGTRVLLDQADAEPRLRRFVHCSTTGVLGATGDQPADETAPLCPGNVYEETKAQAELEVRAAAQAGLPAVIARPGLVYGPGDLHLLGFFRSVLGGRFRPIGRRPVWLHPIYIDDLTEALTRCAGVSVEPGECFHLAGSAPVTLAAMAAAIAGAGGRRAPSGYIPLPAARALAALGDWLPSPLRKAAPLTRSRLEFLTHSRVYDVAKARRLLGFAAATDLTTGAARSLAWYRAHGYLAGGAPS